tara:strand:- start:15785 stop:18763 length:2979 start_codon:yes stop_codon:yes gene_type:complete
MNVDNQVIRFLEHMVNEHSDNNINVMTNIIANYPQIINYTIGDEGDYLLHAAATIGSNDAINVLLDNGANINQLNLSNNTALDLSRLHKNNSSYKLLAQRGNIKTSNNVKYYIKGGSIIPLTEYNTIIKIILSADIDTLKSLLSKYRVNLNDRFLSKDRYSGWTPLILATYMTNTNIMELLINNGASLNTSVSNKVFLKTGKKAIHIAVEEGCLDCIRILLKYTNNQRLLVNDTDFRGNTPLFNVCDFNKNFMKPSTDTCNKIINILIDAGSEIDFTNNQNETALHYAILGQKYEVMKLLISKGSNIEIQDNEGDTPLILATKQHSYGGMNILIDNNADVNAINLKELTPLLIAINDNDISAMKILLTTKTIKYDINDLNEKQANNLNKTLAFIKEREDAIKDSLPFIPKDPRGVIEDYVFKGGVKKDTTNNKRKKTFMNGGIYHKKKRFINGGIQFDKIQQFGGMINTASTEREFGERVDNLGPIFDPINSNIRQIGPFSGIINREPLNTNDERFTCETTESKIKFFTDWCKHILNHFRSTNPRCRIIIGFLNEHYILREDNDITNLITNLRRHSDKIILNLLRTISIEVSIIIGKKYEDPAPQDLLEETTTSKVISVPALSWRNIIGFTDEFGDTVDHYAIDISTIHKTYHPEHIFFTITELNINNIEETLTGPDNLINAINTLKEKIKRTCKIRSNRIKERTIQVGGKTGGMNVPLALNDNPELNANPDDSDSSDSYDFSINEYDYTNFVILNLLDSGKYNAILPEVTIQINQGFDPNEKDSNDMSLNSLIRNYIDDIANDADKTFLENILIEIKSLRDNYLEKEKDKEKADETVTNTRKYLNLNNKLSKGDNVFDKFSTDLKVELSKFGGNKKVSGNELIKDKMYKIVRNFRNSLPGVTNSENYSTFPITYIGKYWGTEDDLTEYYKEINTIPNNKYISSTDEIGNPRRIFKSYFIESKDGLLESCESLIHIDEMYNDGTFNDFYINE